MSVYFDLQKCGFTYKFVKPTQLTVAQTKECETYFEEQKKKSPKLFNAKKFASNRITVVGGNKIEMEVCETDYMRYVWSRSSGYFIQGLQPISVDALFYDDKNIYLLGRSNETQYSSGGFDTIGGTVEFAQNVDEQSFDVHLLNHALEEIEEEVEYSGKKVTASDLSPMVACFNTHLNKLDLLFLVRRPLVKPKNWEGKSIEKIEIDHLEEWIDQNRSRIPEILYNYLYYFGNKFKINEK